ncbi:DUF747-domain-containing protein [Eremomyces bilateralis CBS 781.70]|uniref:DUF747-domain-containing protein n=1 Tax=Eremomyces bilateralis CBS 781.70 TaxID=1392243 RepID=A0A6G1G6B7_9PEZI|nr:DUF747-domain-containing protein [Eremomyces bilateralis CBS 781.70]KAF1813562.1 DUF747-domain-containing protein [Eremomyces bilateralis CBS 781.70]
MVSSISDGQLPTPGLSPETRSSSIDRQPKDAFQTLEFQSLGGISEDSGTATPNTTYVAESILSPTGDPKDARYGSHRSSVSDNRHRSSSGKERDRILKLSPAQLKQLTTSPTAVPLRAATPISGSEDIFALDDSPTKAEPGSSGRDDERHAPNNMDPEAIPTNGISLANGSGGDKKANNGSADRSKDMVDPRDGEISDAKKQTKPPRSSRTCSTPPACSRKQSGFRPHGQHRESLSKTRSQNHVPPSLNLKDSSRVRSDQASGGLRTPSSSLDPIPSPLHSALPLPPVSMPTYLQLELSSEKPSPLYIHRSPATDFPYESSSVKFQRLVNFLLLPPNFEQVMWFGTLACLDAWLYNFTILPLRFIRAVWILTVSLIHNAWRQVRDLGRFIYNGLGRMWNRYRHGLRPSSTVKPNGSATSVATKQEASASDSAPQRTVSRGRERSQMQLQEDQKRIDRHLRRRHRRARSMPSKLLPSHKADILKGLLIFVSCVVLLRFDASRMYHGIRGQAAMKLYVIFNVLEIADRLLSAIGQDVIECLLSQETLERDSYGRSKLIRPFFMFLLALLYNITHATALFYQVITLNVAVNSYSNALLTLLMSNQFVEIKGTVFKKLEKENLFQMTCADVVERFQLWLMMIIIAMRNIVELGDFTIGLPAMMSSTTSSPTVNTTTTPSSSSTILPMSFTILPKWTGQFLGPFVLVLGSEMVVDWIKHAYINKFNNTRPEVYGRFLDVLAKDYYSNAFASQNLTKRLGLPVIPLACLFIRSSLQTYHMFLATHMPLPIPSPVSSIALGAETTSTPAPIPILIHLDRIFRRALGRSAFGAGAGNGGMTEPLEGWSTWVVDDVIALTTLAMVVLVCWLLLLAMKLLLGMALLTFSRNRYHGMKERERQSYTYVGGKRAGGWGMVEVDDDKRRRIYEGDEAGLKKSRERAKETEQGGRDLDKGSKGLDGVDRYAMVAKRIW